MKSEPILDAIARGCLPLDLLQCNRYAPSIMLKAALGALWDVQASDRERFNATSSWIEGVYLPSIRRLNELVPTIST